MNRRKKSSRLLAVFLALLTIFSIVPTSILTASAQTIYTTGSSLSDTGAKKNVYLDALGYLGYKVNDSNMFNTSGNLYNWYHTYRDQLNTSIGYDRDYGTTGLEVTTNGKPNVSKFENGGLCCASYVTYVFLNYLKTVRSVDLVKLGILSTPSNTTDVSSWREMLDSSAFNGKIRSLGKVTAANLQVGDILIYGSDGHIAIYAGYVNGYHWITHCGGTPGPTLDPSPAPNGYLTLAGGISGGGTLSAAYRVRLPEEYGAIEVYKKDPSGNKLSGAKFKVANQSHTFYIGPTDANGYATTGPIVPYGTYTVTETVFPTGYEASGKTSWTVTVGATTQKVTINAVNKKKTGSFQIKKIVNTTGGSTNTFNFIMQKWTGQEWENYAYPKITVSKKTDKLGSWMEGCTDVYNNITPALFRIKEDGVPSDMSINKEGYKASNGTGIWNGDWYEFKVIANTTVTVTAANTLKLGTLKLTKTITDNSNLMKKAETFAFKLYSGKTASGTPLREFSITVNTEGKIESAKWTDTNDPIEIDEENNAAVLFEKIKEGWYTVKEVLTDKQKEVGWVNASSQTVQVKANSESTVTFDNKLCSSSIYIRKTADSMSISEYKGAFEFAVLGVITDGNGAYVQGTQIDNYTGSTAIGGLVGFSGTLIASDISNKLADGYSYRLYLVEFKTQDKYILPKECSYALGSNSGKLEMSGSADLVEVNNAIKAIQKSGFAQDKEYVVSECVTLNKLKDVDNISAGNDLIFSVHNELQMGQIEIHKTGETFSSVTSADGIYTPVYAENALEGAKFAIFAAEDIIVNGRTVYEKGEQVGGNLVTDENGIAVSEELYLGKYTIKEIDAPDGYILTEEQTVELTAENTTQRVTTEIVEVYNKRVKVKVILPKTMQVVDSNGVKHGENGEIKNVVFGLYANEDITAADGKFIPRGGLIETATVNVLGSSANFEFNADLPYGKYYIKEISTDSAYMLHDTTYGFEFSVTDIPADDLTETVEIQLDGIENRALGDIVGVKKDIKGELVPGCEFQLYATTEICDAYGNRKYAAGDKVGGTVFSDKNGRFGWSGLYYGTYEIVEVSVPEGYVLPELAVVTDITINYRNTVQSVEVTNDYTKVSFLKIDENGNPLAGAEFALYRKEDYENDSEKAKPIATWVSTTEAKLFEKLAFGDYVVIETKAPQGYTLCGTPEYFTVENSGETIEISLPNRPVLKVLSGGKGFFPQTLVGVALVGLGAILFTYGFRTKKKKLLVEHSFLLV